MEAKEHSSEVAKKVKFYPTLLSSDTRAPIAHECFPSYPPEDFDWILVQFNNDDIQPIIVAGQAVNIWGKTFRDWDAKFNLVSERCHNRSKVKALTSTLDESLRQLRDR